MSEPTGRPARYQRTFGGLIGSMVVLLLAVGVFVVFRSLVRDDPDGRPAAVDWQTTVRAAAGAGDTVVHPDRIPGDWTVTSANYRPGTVPEERRWDLGVLTSGQRFVGLAQTGTTLGQLVTTYVDDGATAGKPVRIGGRFAGTWQTWTDSGGDYAVGRELTGRLAGQVLLVFGSAPADEVRGFAADLTAAALPQASASVSASSSASPS